MLGGAYLSFDQFPTAADEESCSFWNGRLVNVPVFGRPISFQISFRSKPNPSELSDALIPAVQSFFCFFRRLFFA